MDGQAVLERLTALGVTARVEADKILIQPASKVPPELMDAVRENKPELLTILADPQNALALMARLRAGHTWLLDQHQRWLHDDSTAADDAEFSRVWNAWWELDQRLRADLFQGCIYSPDGSCPEGFACQSCCDVPAPAVVAQLELSGRNE